METLYKDDYIVVCIKPAGLLSAKDSSGKANMIDLISQELGCDTVYPIHRLDRDVSGVMVYALTPDCASSLSRDAADHTRFIKEYIAVVSGVPNSSSGEMEDLLFKDSNKNKTYVVARERKGVKKARLQYKVKEIFGDKSLIEIRLFTGRTHQIRVQFSHRKMSIVGDRKYGGISNQKGIALRSVRLTFYHPKTKNKMIFEKIPSKEELIDI